MPQPNHHIHQKQINATKRDLYTYEAEVRAKPHRKCDKHILMVCPKDNTFYAHF